MRPTLLAVLLPACVLPPPATDAPLDTDTDTADDTEVDDTEVEHTDADTDAPTAPACTGTAEPLDAWGGCADTGWSCVDLDASLERLRAHDAAWAACLARGTTCTDDRGRRLVVHVRDRTGPTEVRYFDEASGALVAVAETDAPGTCGPTVRWFGEVVSGCAVTDPPPVGCDTGALCAPDLAATSLPPYRPGPSGCAAWPEGDAKVPAVLPASFFDVRPGVGDLTGDGVDDVLTTTGVLPGASGLLDAARPSPVAHVDLPDGGVFLTGGDLDGDGIADLVVGHVASDLGGPDSGAVLVFYGPLAGTLDASTADLVLPGAPGERVGRDVTVAGDLDGDGDAEVVLPHGPGTLRVVDPEALGDGPHALADVGATWTTPAVPPAVQPDLGVDLDGDGVDELVVRESGSVRRVLPAALDGGDLDAAPGWTGVERVLRRAPGEDGADALLLLVTDPATPGVPALTRHTTRPTGLQDARSTAQGVLTGSPALRPSDLVAVPDLDGDGLDDLVAVLSRSGLRRACSTLPGTSLPVTSEQGLLVHVPGPLDGLRTLASLPGRLWGEVTGDRLGVRVVELGDVDADGRPDVLVAGERDLPVGGTDSLWYALPDCAP